MEKAEILKNKWVKTTNSKKEPNFQNIQEYQKMLDKLCPSWVPVNPDRTPYFDDKNSEFVNIPFTKAKFYIALESRGEKSTPGINGINYEVVHKIPHKYQLILLDIFNKMFRKDVYPIE